MIVQRVKKHNMAKKDKIGLVLSGGGARAAYQVGAIKAIYEIGKSCDIDQPFRIFSGTSAGSINVCHLAAFADKPHQAIKRLSHLLGKCNLRSGL